MIIETDRVFGTGEYTGQEGVLVTVNNVTVSMHKGKTIYAYARVIRDVNPPFCEKQIIYKIETANQKFSSLQFRFPYSEIREIYGTGKQTFYVQFMFYTLAGSLPQILDDFIMNKMVVLDLKEESDQVLTDPVLKKNREYIEKRAQNEKLYARVQQLAGQTGLDFYIRGYALSSGAAQDYTVTNPAPADETNIAVCLGILVPFLESLPGDFIKASKLKGIALTKGITFYGYSVGGGVDIFNRVVLLTDITPQNEADPTLLHIFCHEFFHYLEKIFYMHIDVKHWESLNPPGFAYDKGGAMDYVMTARSDVMEEHAVKGFVTRYAASDHFQDRAELFAYLMVPELYGKAEAWIAADPYLKAKFEYMKIILKKIYPALNENWLSGR